MTQLSPGQRLRSQVCATEVVVVRAGDGSVEPTCGGLPLVAIDAATGAGSVAAAADVTLMSGNAIGKRYTSPTDPTFEVLVTKAGAGTLGDGPTPLELREAKPLPASD
ncbi:hypothetical protein P5P86_10015 [Nocardioides sp. BP30]|uniref:hypothetical protein n=1 Tax=Nocardioides sp. BP30 TaxID=3036374 RepID=UPI0024698373|nr:hypothetical protein [Nocardioides sp. BP30]WGL54147.1 hypothetical protein P5P86_10015 [Nocardioides sp. BP30]